MDKEKMNKRELTEKEKEMVSGGTMQDGPIRREEARAGAGEAGARAGAGARAARARTGAGERAAEAEVVIR